VGVSICRPSARRSDMIELTESGGRAGRARVH
jgi:hypothetical protein